MQALIDVSHQGAFTYTAGVRTCTVPYEGVHAKNQAGADNAADLPGWDSFSQALQKTGYFEVS